MASSSNVNTIVALLDLAPWQVEQFAKHVTLAAVVAAPARGKCPPGPWRGVFAPDARAVRRACSPVVTPRSRHEWAVLHRALTDVPEARAAFTSSPRDMDEALDLLARLAAALHARGDSYLLEPREMLVISALDAEDFADRQASLRRRLNQKSPDDPARVELEAALSRPYGTEGVEDEVCSRAHARRWLILALAHRAMREAVGAAVVGDLLSPRQMEWIDEHGQLLTEVRPMSLRRAIREGEALVDAVWKQKISVIFKEVG